MRALVHLSRVIRPRKDLLGSCVRNEGGKAQAVRRGGSFKSSQFPTLHSFVGTIVRIDH